MLFLPAVFLCHFGLSGGEAPFLAVSHAEIFLLGLVLPTSLFIQRAHGQHNMSVRIMTGRVRIVDSNVSAHSVSHKLLLDELLQQFNLHLPVKLSRQCNDELPRKTAVLGFLRFLYGIP